MSLQQTQKPSALDQYTSGYMQKLQSALAGVATAMNGITPAQQFPTQQSPVMDTAQSGQGADIGADVVEPEEPGGTTDPDPQGPGAITPMQSAPPAPASALEQPAPASQPPAAPAQDQVGPPTPGASALEDKKKKGGTSFDDLSKKVPDKIATAQVDKLEEALKKGNETIDSAYDEMVKQLGTAPDEKLSRKEKGMLLMKFGLTLLANSRKGISAVGEAGDAALGEYQKRTEDKTEEYKKKREAIEFARGKSKVDLATQSALESVKVHGGLTGRLPGRFGSGGKLWFNDESGQVQPAIDPKTGEQLPDDGSGSEGGRGEFEFQAKQKAWIEEYGKDPLTDKPLTGVALARVKRRALDIGLGAKSPQEWELRNQAERDANELVKANIRGYEDQGMTPEQIIIKRNQIADDNYARLRKNNFELNSPEPTPEGGRGRPNRPKKNFTTQEEAKAAYDRGEINIGDRIVINGVEDTVQ